MMGYQLYGTDVKEDNRRSEDKQALGHSKDTTQNKERRYRVALCWKGQQKNFDNQYFAALSQFDLFVTKLGKDENVKKRFFRLSGLLKVT